MPHECEQDLTRLHACLTKFFTVKPSFADPAWLNQVCWVLTMPHEGGVCPAKKRGGAKARGMILRWALLKAFGPDRWYFAALLNGDRNARFAAALQRLIKRLQDSAATLPSLADIGAGSGIYAIIAAQEGLRNVTRYERLLPLAKIELEMAKLNQASIKVLTSLPCDDSSSDEEQGIVKSASYDIVVLDVWHSSFLGEMDAGLLGGGVLSALDKSWRSGVISEQTLVIPHAARLMCMLIHLPPQPELIRCPISTVCGFDLSLFSRFRSDEAEPVILEHTNYTPLTDPFPLFHFDLGSPSAPATAGRTTAMHVPLTCGGACNAVVLWHELALHPRGAAEDDWLAAAPGSRCRQSLQFLPSELSLPPGGLATVTAQQAATRVHVHVASAAPASARAQGAPLHRDGASGGGGGEDGGVAARPPGEARGTVVQRWCVVKLWFKLLRLAFWPPLPCCRWDGTR